MRLHLIRHAAVVVRPEQPSKDWHLSPEGRTATEGLASDADWTTLARLYTSSEPKAIATAQRIAMRNALPISIESALHEVERPWAGGDHQEYRELARSYLCGEPVDGWEPRETSATRIRASIETIVSAHSQADVGVVSHGLVLSLFLGALLGLDGRATAALWDGIAFPDYAIVDPSARTLVRPFSA